MRLFDIVNQHSASENARAKDQHGRQHDGGMTFQLFTA